MRNTYFQFQQFRVDQDRCALRVCTDACIQGAATGQWLREHLDMEPQKRGTRVLDIGTGTGLLSLMMAQVLPGALIEAVELDPDAAVQAGENFSRSPWAGRLKLIQTDIRDFLTTAPYDVIICNPPFYENDLRSGDISKDVAKHALALSFTALAEALDRLGASDGFFSVMLPYGRFQRWEQKALAAGFFPRYLLDVSQSPAHGIFRTIGIFGRGKGVAAREHLVIRDAAGKYTSGVRRLLGDYYLYFPGD